MKFLSSGLHVFSSVSSINSTNVLLLAFHECVPSFHQQRTRSLQRGCATDDWGVERWTSECVGGIADTQQLQRRTTRTCLSNTNFCAVELSRRTISDKFYLHALSNRCSTDFGLWIEQVYFSLTWTWDSTAKILLKGFLTLFNFRSLGRRCTLVRIANS